MPGGRIRTSTQDILTSRLIRKNILLQTREFDKMSKYNTLNRILNDISSLRRDDKIVTPLPLDFHILLMVAEDHRYPHHIGVDGIALVRSLWKTIARSERQGGSTIAMQLVRTITGRHEITVSRKITEIWLAVKLGHFMTKSEIIETYASIAYFGWNMHGLPAACLELKIDFNSLSLTEMAQLIARLKYPEPKFHSRRSTYLINRRASHILARYQKLGVKLRHEWFSTNSFA